MDKQTITAYVMLALSIVFGVPLLIFGLVVVFATGNVILGHGPLLAGGGLAVILIGLGGIGWHKMKMARLARREKEEALEREREAHNHRLELDNKQHDLEVQRFALEQHIAITRLPADMLGNYPVVMPREELPYAPLAFVPGNSPHAPRVQKVTEVEPVMPELPKSAALALPDIEEFYEQIAYNSLQVGLGVQLSIGEPILADIIASTHFKFIGGSDTGKSCIAAALLDMAIQTNDPDHLRIGLLDLEHKTSRLFEDAPHVYEVGRRRVRLIGRDPDEVASRIGLLKEEMDRRARLSEMDLQREPILLVYVEEMLALKYEVSEELKDKMLADLNVIAVRCRKYRIYLLAVMQIDYSDKAVREASRMFRTRGGFALDMNAARASGFMSTDLLKQNFKQGRKGQYVLEKPGFAGLVLAPYYDVKAKLAQLDRPTTRSATNQDVSHYGATTQEQRWIPRIVDSEPTTDTEDLATTGTLQANLTPQERRIIQKFRSGQSVGQIIGSEFTNSAGKPLTGGDLFMQKSREINALIARFLPQVEEA